MDLQDRNRQFKDADDLQKKVYTLQDQLEKLQEAYSELEHKTKQHDHETFNDEWLKKDEQQYQDSDSMFSTRD